MRDFRTLALVLNLGVFVPSMVLAADTAIDFNRDVRPILSDSCFACHGFDAKARKAELRLDVPEGAFTLRDGRAAVKAGDLKASELWERINSTDPDTVMPPPHTKKSLSADKKETLRRWIEQGAKYAKHWSFEPVVRPTPPQVAGARTPIDAFLLTRIHAAGLSPQPDADRETLIRRVAFSLTGLPPTIKEVDEYLADETPQAYENMIDRYLASQHYGEEMARHWLDVARYADTHGLHLDNERQMWAYRDWVVQAFNQNLSFDKFTVWQLAGDLLPNPTTEQLVATGFNRCNVTTSEGGSIGAEFEYRYAVERTTATAQAWLGLTAGCAVCHDHKYDPLTTKEFYSLYAFFRSAADPAMDGNINTTPPFLKLPTPDLTASVDAAGRVEREARAWLDLISKSTVYADPADAKPVPANKLVREELFDDALPLGSTSKSSSRNAIDWDYAPAFAAASGRRSIRLAHAVGSNCTIDFKLRPMILPQEGVLEAWIYVDHLDTPASVTITLDAKGGKKSIVWNRVNSEFVRELKSGKESKSIANEVVPGKWCKVSIRIDEIGLKPGNRINGIVLDQKSGVVHFDAMAITGQADPTADPLESFSAWRAEMGTTAPPDVPKDISSLVTKGPKAELKADEQEKLVKFYLAVVARPVSDELASARMAWLGARAARIAAEEQSPGTFVFRDQAKPVEAFVMMRGQYDKPSDKVEPAGPQILPPIKPAKAGERLNRLDLANWLVSPENPLASRVIANRLWQQFFGTGIVRTSYDFGAQGESPSHPELLDWLASELMAKKWDVKQFSKMLLMSDAFRRSAKSSAEIQSKDPANRLYVRGPRYRLDAEQIRDNALAVSGLLNLAMGGRGVKPYQPANLWEPIGYSDSNTRYYLQDHGAALYKRSLYVFLKRTAPPPFMSNFDAPNREQVCLVRERSNTPIQALQLLNDVQFFEAARALAERTLSAEGSSPADRVAFLYRTVLSRSPDADESKLISDAVEKQLAFYAANPAAAKQVVETGESVPKRVAADAETAAWTVVANLILNLDETLNRN